MPTDTIDPPTKTDAKFKIPSLSELLKGPTAAPEAKPVTPANPPDDKIPTKIIPDAPVKAPVEDDDDEPIDTQIRAPMHPTGKKPEDFARERRESKGGKQKADEFQKMLEKAEAERTRIQLELDTEREARKKDQEERENFRTLATTREKDIEALNSKYFETFKPQYDAGRDEEVMTSHQEMVKNIKESLPAFYPKNGNQERLMFDTIARDGQKMQGLEQAMQYYAQAMDAGRTDVADLAVNSVAGLLGADVEVIGLNDPRNRVMDANDEFFRSVESAMKKGLPHLSKKINRLTFIRDNEPKLAEERFSSRRQAIHSDLNAAFTFAPEQIASALQADKNDSMALFGAVMNHSPALREQVQAAIARTSDVLSSVSDQILMPPLKQNDAASVAEHRKQFHERREHISKLSRYAIIGQMCGPILAALIAERDEAASRADAAADLTNPGSSRTTDGKPPVIEEEIPTQIMPPIPGLRKQ